MNTIYQHLMNRFAGYPSGSSIKELCDSGYKTILFLGDEFLFARWRRRSWRERLLTRPWRPFKAEECTEMTAITKTGQNALTMKGA